MLCKCHWIVLYTVHFTAFCLGGAVFSRTRCILGEIPRVGDLPTSFFTRKNLQLNLCPLKIQFKNAIPGLTPGVGWI